LRLVSPLAACAAAAVVLAGCGGSKGGSPTTPTTTVSAAANTTYERANSECSTVKPLDLAHKYNVKNAKDKDKIATAVGNYWANRTGGGSDAQALGKQGCLDGFKFAGR
jgi:hypothetical protein